MQYCFVLSRKSLATSGVRDGHRNRKLQKITATSVRYDPAGKPRNIWSVSRKSFLGSCPFFFPVKNGLKRF